MIAQSHVYRDVRIRELLETLHALNQNSTIAIVMQVSFKFIHIVHYTTHWNSMEIYDHLTPLSHGMSTASPLKGSCTFKILRYYGGK